MTERKPPVDDWEEPDLSHLQNNMKNLKLPPGFVPDPGQPEPSYVPNSPAGAYAPQPRRAPVDPKDFQTPEEAMAYMNSGANAMLNPTYQNASTMKPTFIQPTYTTAPTPAPTVNPLLKYTRTPGMYVSLPSKGAYNPDEIAFEMNGEIPVYPMTSGDETLMKNPDALMSGAAMEQIIRSCVPAVKNPRTLPIADLDVLILAIREASYGNFMEFEAECPSCGTKQSYTTNIREMIECASPLAPHYIVTLPNGLVAHMRPQTMNAQTKISLATFQEAKRIQIISNEELPEDVKTAQINESMKRLTDINTELTVDCIDKIVTPEGDVTDKGFIMEFITNADRKVGKVIDDTLKEMNDAGVNKVKTLKCIKEECGHEWQSDIVFDPTSFFE